jgi:hypothetical protein
LIAAARPLVSDDGPAFAFMLTFMIDARDGEAALVQALGEHVPDWAGTPCRIQLSKAGR